MAIAAFAAALLALLNVAIGRYRWAGSFAVLAVIWWLTRLAILKRERGDARRSSDPGRNEGEG